MVIQYRAIRQDPDPLASNAEDRRDGLRRLCEGYPIGSFEDAGRPDCRSEDIQAMDFLQRLFERARLGRVRTGQDDGG